MKKSNKLLIGLFGLILLGMIIFNYSLTKEIKNSNELNNRIQQKLPTNTLLNDSIELNKNDINK